MAKILIVDDSRTSRKFLRTMLEADQHEIIGEASNGIEGIAKYKELHPDITTMDITMPELDGIDALKKIMEFDPQATVVMVTAAGQKNKIVEAVKYGAKDFLPKPFEAEQIRSIINNLV